jgi:hypothetical protein
VLAAQYESLRLPLAIILIVPMCLLRDDRRLAHRRRQQHLHPDRPDRAGRPGCKNAILIVEFARELDAGMTPSRPRSRPAACACARS